MEFDETRLADALAGMVPDHERARFCVALSGGADSTVLLHALARLGNAWPEATLRAIHIDHGLHPDSPEWADHCAATTDACGVALQSFRVGVTDNRDQGVEAAARVARYDCLRQQISAGEILLTAHHADDQLETVLLQLMRGTGVAGLAGMPALVAFGAGYHGRPLLGFDRAALLDYGNRYRLRWLADPANDDPRFDRSFLRQAVVPLLRRRWPAAAFATSRSASHCAEALQLCDALAASDLDPLVDQECLDCAGLKGLPPVRMRNALRYWIRRSGKPVPSARILSTIVTDLIDSACDATPVVTWAGTEMRRHRNRLYLMAPLPEFAPEPIAWSVPDALWLGDGRGRIGVERVRGGGLAAARIDKGRVTVRCRTGGESLTPSGHRQGKDLKKLFQEHGIVPWMRERIPLVFVDGKLAAVADICVAGEFSADHDEAGYRIVWEDHPRIR